MNKPRQSPQEDLSTLSDEGLFKLLRDIEWKKNKIIEDKKFSKESLWIWDLFSVSQQLDNIIQELHKRKEYLICLIKSLSDEYNTLEPEISYKIEKSVPFSEKERQKMYQNSRLLSLLWYGTDWKPLKTPDVVINVSGLVATQLTFKWIPELELILERRKKKKKKKK